MVDIVQERARIKKVGHAGTLDPLASGVLVVCLGQATRLIDEIQKGAKSYSARFTLGCRSDTDDIDGEVEQIPDARQPALDEIRRALPAFLGVIQQRPPAYSAVKVAGRRAYHLARKGHDVELKPRPVEIFRLDIVAYAYPRLDLDVVCGSGTYIRSLGRDLAAAVGTTAVMSALTRTAVGPYRLSDAVSLDQFNEDNLADHLLSPLSVFPDKRPFTLNAREVQALRQGQAIIGREAPPASPWPAVDEDGQLVALVKERSKKLQPVRVFSA